MTVEQQEQQILDLIYKLPILRRIRLALTVLKGVDVEQIEISQPTERESWESPEFFEELDQRHEAMLNGEDSGVPAEELFQQIGAKLP
jgi:hypothetical protein